jgi:hypothetical protein
MKIEMKEKQSPWTRFWAWYDRHITESLAITALIIYIQIPHMIWNADLYLEAGMISHVHPVLDFFMYGVDLIEIFPMINIGFLIYSRIRKSRNLINA